MDAPPAASRRAALAQRQIEANASHHRAAEDLTGLPGTAKLLSLIRRKPENLSEKEAEFVNAACMGLAGKVVEDCLRADVSLDEIARGIITAAQFARKKHPE